jgi:hypothetical protein
MRSNTSNSPRRRELITNFGAAPATVAGARSAQPGRLAPGMVLLLQSKGSQQGKHPIAAVREELKKLVWTEGCDIWIDARYTNGNVHRNLARWDGHLGGEFT